MSESDPAALRAQPLCDVCNRLECVAQGWFRGNKQHNLEWIKHWHLGYELARDRAEEAEKARDEALVGLKTCAPTVCGTNALFPPTRMGCGQSIGLETHVFRCADCCTVFHRDCLKKHCADDLAALREEKARLATEHGRVFEALASTMARAEEAEKERDEALAALHDWYCVGCKQRYCAPPDEGTSRSSCPKCGKWMLFFAEHEREKQAMLLGEARTAWRMLLRVSLAPEDVSGVHMYEEARATLDRIDAFLAGPAAPPLPSAEQQETLSGAPAACPGLDRLNAETGEEYGQLVVDSSSAPPMSLEWFRDEYVRRSSVMEAWHRYFDELCDVLFPESIGRGRLIGWKHLIARAKGNAADRPPPVISVDPTLPPDGASPGRFTCPRCSASHDRGFFGTRGTYRCLGCGYVGHGFHPDPEVDAEIGKAIRAEQKWQREHGLPEGPFAPDEAAWREHKERARSAPPAPPPSASAEKQEGSPAFPGPCPDAHRHDGWCGTGQPRAAPTSTENTPETPEGGQT